MIAILIIKVTKYDCDDYQDEDLNYEYSLNSESDHI